MKRHTQARGRMKVEQPRARPAGEARSRCVGDGVYGVQAEVATSSAASSSSGQSGSATRIAMARAASGSICPGLLRLLYHMIGAAALAIGFGVGWVDLDVDALEPAAEIALRPEQAIEGQLFDINGQFAQGVQVSVEAIGHPQRGPESLPDGVEGGPHFWGGSYAKIRAAWPRPSKSGKDGRFTIRGTGRDLRVWLIAEDPRFARQRIVVDTQGTRP